ncbi:MAG: hypothetical protein QOI46_862 [Alphaproteobacteria bacterium]|jgi:hypothetical protein|nr:hypothetical protein [Alphaproteobacteria bacterium]
MKTMILAAFALLTLGVGAAHAPPNGWEPPVYGSQAFSDNRNDPVVHFLGKETVLGKMFRYHSNSEQAAAATTPAKGGLIIRLPQEQASATNGPLGR